MATNIQDVRTRFEELLSNTSSHLKGKALYLEYIGGVHQIKSQVPDFPTGLDWVNTSQPLSTSSLDGKLVLLDFFTYCCINCMHILPDLHELEQKFSVADGLVVVGVHSAKFPNEKQGANIQAAVERYGIKHPVVNDSEAVLWSRLGIQCWPTIVMIGPSGQILAEFIGEGHKQELCFFVEAALEFYSDKINHDPLPFIESGLRVGKHTRPLRYPSRTALFKGSVIITDTGNHRILIVGAKTGNIEQVVGSGESSSQDGDYSTCSFVSPLGVCVVQDCLYVTDSDANLIRKVDTLSRKVSTVMGTGELGTDRAGGKQGVEQVISSPWDIVSYSSKGVNSAADILLIAMAGTHQIWAYFLQDVTWWKNKQHSAGTCVAIAGTGEELNRNNSYPHRAAFAQPSGLSIDPVQSLMYIADSESSSVRTMSLKDGSVRALIGGDRDPTNLFSFGDIDGKGIEAKLQHPLHVSCVPDSTYLFICDTYNHKIKLVDTLKKHVTSLFVSGLNEPSGIQYSAEWNTLVITDCNNHAIKQVQILASNIPLCLSADIDEAVEEFTVKPNKDIVDGLRTAHLFDVHSGNVTRIQNKCDTFPTAITYKLSEGTYLTKEAVSKYLVTWDGNLGSIVAQGELPSHDCTVEHGCLSLTLPDTSPPTTTASSLHTELLIYYCSSKDNVCKRMCVVIEHTLTQAS